MNISIFSIILIQLFWISFASIGWAELGLIKIHFPTLGSKLSSLLNDTHVLIKLFLFWAVGASSLLVYIVPAYIFPWPVYPVVLAYLILIVGSLTLVFIRLLHEDLKGKIKKVLSSRSTLVILGIVGAALLISYIMALVYSSPDYGDASVFISKIYQLAFGGHFTLKDAYFGNNGVTQPGYSIYFLANLEAIAVRILRVSPINLWIYSNAFCLLLVWVSVFSVTYTYIADKSKQWWSYVVLGLSPFIYVTSFMQSEIPQRIAIVWICLLFVGFKILFERKTSFVFFIAVCLIATTHTLNSTMAIGFICLLGVLYLVFKKLDKRTALVFSVAILILAWPVGYALSFPKHVPSQLTALVSYGPLKIEPIPHIYPGLLAITGAVVGAAYLLFFKKIRGKFNRITVHLVVSAFVALVISVVYASFFGLVYLLLQAKNLKVRLLITAAIIYYSLIIFNPIILHLTRNLVPSWALERFQDFNVLALATPIIGYLFILSWPLLKWGYKKLAIGFSLALPAIVLILPIHLFFQGFPYTTLDYHDLSSLQASYVSELKVLEPFRSLMNNQVVFTDNAGVAILLPNVALVNTVDVYGADSAPMSNYVIRQQCGATLNRSLSLNDLKAAHVTEVLSQPYGEQDRFSRLASSKPYLKLIQTEGSIRLYRVENSPSIVSEQTASVCNIPYGQ